MIGAKVKRLRKEKGLSLSELAERADIAKSYLSNLERDIQTNPSINVLEKIATVLNVPVEHILGVNKEEPLVIDDEWQELIKEAMSSGVDKKEFRAFLEYNKWRINRPNE